MFAAADGASHSRKILIADDHQLLLDGLKEMMKFDFDVLAVDNGQDFLNAVGTFQPDAAILDVSLPGVDGFLTARRALELRPSLPIMFLSMHTESSYVDQAAQIGAKAYLSKQLPAKDVIAAVRSVLHGETLLDPARGATRSSIDAATALPSDLTPRQQEVLRLIACGYKAKDIAGRLNISVRTAEFHRSVIMQKLGLHSTAQMTRYAIAHGLA